MLARSVTGEAARNLASGTSRALWLALAFVVVIGGLAVADARVLVRIWQDVEDFRSAGATVQVLASERDQVVDGARCQGLAGATGVTGAGALRPGEPFRAMTMPSTGITVWEVTPGVIELLATTSRPIPRPGSTTGGIWLSDDLAETLGVSAGDELVTDGGRVGVSGLYSWQDDGRDRVLGYAAVAPVPALGTFDQCWAEVWPAAPDVAGLLYSTAAPAAADLRLGQLNTTRGTAYDLSDAIAARPTAASPAIAAAVGILLGFLAVRVRRLELASALHARVPRSQLAWQHVLEAGAWVCAAAIMATAASGVAASLGSPEPLFATWATAGMAVGAGAVSVLIGTAIGVAATREKHLFRYFKER